jgi:hypothetical protein
MESNPLDFGDRDSIGRDNFSTSLADFAALDRLIPLCLVGMIYRDTVDDGNGFVSNTFVELERMMEDRMVE